MSHKNKFLLNLTEDHTMLDNINL